MLLLPARASRVGRRAPCAWGGQLRGAHEGQHTLTELLESGQALRKDQHDPLRPWHSADVGETGGTVRVGADNRVSAHIRDALQYGSGAPSRIERRLAHHGGE